MLMLQKISLNSTGHGFHIESSGKLRCYEELDIGSTTEEDADTLSSCSQWKPRSGLGNLQHRDITFVDFEGDIIGTTFVARQPKQI